MGGSRRFTELARTATPARRAPFPRLPNPAILPFMNRPFTPTQIVFAPTARCNLSCAHCRVERDAGTGTQKLTAESAVAFMTDCASHGIDRIGFSGGEPFLAVDFIEAVCASAVEQGLYFDRLMTNGVWFADEAELRSALSRVYDSGFDGTIAVSVDDWHDNDEAKLATFFKSTMEIFGRGDCLEVVSVGNRDGTDAGKRLRALAKNIGANLVCEGGVPRYIQDDKHRTNRERGMDDGTGVYIPIVTLPYSAPAGDSEAWKDSRWFSDDFCEGPGNVFYAHPDGSVAVCCGFANDNAALIAGTVADGYEKLLASARANPYVRACYEKGLGALRQDLEKAGTVFPGKTSDPCFFCDYLCSKGLTGKKPT